MRVALVAIGSRGDVQPFLALGAALHARGHEVRLATHADFRALAAEASLEFRPLPGSPARHFENPDLVKALRKSPSVIRLARAVPRAAAEAEASGLAALNAYVRAAVDGVDVVVASALVRNLFLAAPPTVPWCLASWYLNTPTVAFPAMGAPRLPLGGWYNRLTYRVSQQFEWRVYRPGVNAYRRVDGSPPLGLSPPFGAQERGRPLFYLHSPAVLTPPPDWPAWYHAAGYWFWDRDWKPPAAVADAVEREPAPVVLTFGSLWPVYPPGSLDMIADVVRSAGRGLVVVDGPSENLPEGVVRLHDADYGWLFPRAAAVIHHGGFGTGAAALRAGVPQVVAPIFVDHPHWARRMAALGVAPPAVPGARLNRGAMVVAVDRVLGDRWMRERAAQLGRYVSSDRALERACAVLEQWVSGELRYPE